ncbi:serine O-acetyltransferase [Bacteroides pyogenes]|uniref:serine O-acetyltransferase n=1 Tax=Bacteroides pyogenes TaxID=310300 RepID=UPI0011E3E9E7|nr:serine acetyltransferase [Bacteroides pyogenes]TYK37820.1 serine acetyltransferase [Bacteroides pyogenes]
MIQTIKDLKYYLEQDRKALNAPDLSIIIRLKQLIFPEQIWKYERILRKLEFYSNVFRKNSFNKFVFAIPFWVYKIKFRRQSVKLGFSIPINVCGPGLSIAHYGTIIINSKAKIGRNFRIHAGVNIGASAGKNCAPVIGDNVYVGPGSVLFGDICIASNTTIGANSTVNKSVVQEHTMVAGNPATIIKQDYPNWLQFNSTQI